MANEQLGRDATPGEEVPHPIRTQRGKLEPMVSQQRYDVTTEAGKAIHSGESLDVTVRGMRATNHKARRSDDARRDATNLAGNSEQDGKMATCPRKSLRKMEVHTCKLA